MLSTVFKERSMHIDKRLFQVTVYSCVFKELCLLVRIQDRKADTGLRRVY